MGEDGGVGFRNFGLGFVYNSNFGQRAGRVCNSLWGNVIDVGLLIFRFNK